MSFRSNIQVKGSLIISRNLHKTDLRFLFLTLIIVGFSFLEGLAQHPLDVEGTIFSKKSTPGYNILTTNTDESSQCDLTMYNNSSALTILHYGTNHPSEARSSAIRFTQDLIFSRTDGMERMRIQNNGNLAIGTKAPGAGRAILNPFNHYYIKTYDRTVNFEDGTTQSGNFIIATTDSLEDASGVHGNGNTLTLWSPGDEVEQLGVAAHLVILDEDAMGLNDANPYNDGATVAYLNTAGMWTVSDRNKKEEIQKIDEGALQKIKNLNAYRYQYKQNARELEKKQPQSKVIGLMAQELENIIPEAVNKTVDGEYFVNYNQVTPVLVEAIKEQQNVIEKMERDQKIVTSENADLRDRLQKLEQLVQAMRTQK